MPNLKVDENIKYTITEGTGNFKYAIQTENYNKISQNLNEAVLYLDFEDNFINKIDNTEMKKVGDVTFTEGKIGKGIKPGSFTRNENSSNYVEIPASYFNYDKISINFWLYINNINSVIDQFSVSIIENYNCQSQVLFDIQISEDQKLYILYWDRNITFSPKWIKYHLNEKEWYHICFQIDKSNHYFELFIDGKSVGKLTDNAVANNLTENPRIFGWVNNCSSNNTTNADVIIDELYIYNDLVCNYNSVDANLKINVEYPKIQECNKDVLHLVIYNGILDRDKKLIFGEEK